MNNDKVKAELDAILSTLMTDKKMKQSDRLLIAQNNPVTKQKISESNKRTKQLNPITKERKQRIGDAMRGKTLEEILGEERAAAGKQARSQFHKGKRRPAEVGVKIAATRRANGSYDVGGMAGKSHKESTKSIMSLKAEIRQELKRKHGLGKSDKVPQELLDKAYKKAGLL